MDPYQWTMQISKLAVIPLDNTQGLTGGRVELHCINSQYISYTVELVRAWHLPTYHRLLSSLPRQPMRTMGGTQSDIDDYTARERASTSTKRLEWSAKAISSRTAVGACYEN